MQPLDPHQRPPDNIRKVYKKYQKMKVHDLDRDPEIVDLSTHLPTNGKDKVRLVDAWSTDRLTTSFTSFCGTGTSTGEQGAEDKTSSTPVYEYEDMPGLHIIPSLLPPEIQLTLLSRLLHRDLAEPSHLTNIHTHYNISYPPPDSSFFSFPPTSPDIVAHPIDSSIHRPLNVQQLLNRKMRWTTLGGQYDWTQKRYPDSTPPPFPPDIKRLLEDLFTDTKAEAAIVNLYSPGDTLSVHRDVAESSPTGLISVSLGCDAIFVIGTSSATDPSGIRPDTRHSTTEEKVLTLRLRSGSAVYMSGSSRFAWHGVPQIVPETCPAYLESWPAGDEDGDGSYEEWRGWMKTKRVNLNVRQMREQ